MKRPLTKHIMVAGILLFGSPIERSLAQSVQSHTDQADQNISTPAPPTDSPSGEKLPAALKPSVRAGAKISFLGKTGILRSYQITSKREDGTFYSVPCHVTPDGHILVLGYAFLNGHNVTRLQLQRLEVRIAEQMTGAPISPPLDVDAPDDDLTMSPQDTSSQEQAPTPQAVQPAPPAPKPLSASSPASMRSLIASSVASFTIGDNGPEIYFITSANCASCLNAWPSLYNAVMQNRIKLSVIFIPTTPSSLQIATNILQKEDPLSAWQSYVNTQTLNNASPNNQYQPNQIAAGLQKNKDFLSQIGQTPAYLPILMTVNQSGQPQIFSATTDTDTLIRNSAL